MPPWCGGCKLIRKLEHVQRLAWLHITGAIRTTPTRALEITMSAGLSTPVSH